MWLFDVRKLRGSNRQDFHQPAWWCTLSQQCALVYSLHTGAKCAQAFNYAVHT